MKAYDIKTRFLPMRSGRICEMPGCQGEAKAYVTFRQPSKIAGIYMPAMVRARRVCWPHAKEVNAQEADVCA